MKRTIINALMAVLLSVSFVAAPSLAAADGAKHFYDFQKTYQPWQAGTWKVPVTKQTLQVKYEKTEARLNGFAALTATPTDAAWMLNFFKPTGNNVVIQFDARYTTPTKHLVPILYVGDVKPSSIKDFQEVGTHLQANWQTYTYKTVVKGDMIVVAIGFIDLYDDPAGTLYTHQAGFDNVTVKISD